MRATLAAVFLLLPLLSYNTVEAQLPPSALRLSKPRSRGGSLTSMMMMACTRPTSAEPAGAAVPGDEWATYYECRARESRVVTGPGAPQGLFKIWTPDEGKAFWGAPGVSSLTSASLFFDNHRIGSTLEAASGTVGPVFVAVTLTGAGSGPGAGPNTSGTTPATTPIASNEPAVARMLQGGGTAAINVSYPWLYTSAHDGDYAVVGLLRGSVGGDAPAISTIEKNASGLFLLTPELSAHAVGETIGLEGGLSWQFASASSPFYAEQLGLQGRSGSIVNFRFGALILKRSRLGFIAPIHAFGGLRGAEHFMAYAQEIVGF